MTSSRDSLEGVWTDATDFESTGRQLLVVVAAAVVGSTVAWELSEAWERAFGYSSTLTVVTAFVAFFTVYLCLSYVVSHASLSS